MDEKWYQNGMFLYSSPPGGVDTLWGIYLWEKCTFGAAWISLKKSKTGALLGYQTQIFYLSIVQGTATIPEGLRRSPDPGPRPPVKMFTNTGDAVT